MHARSHRLRISADRQQPNARSTPKAGQQVLHGHSHATDPEVILDLQRTVGNHAVQFLSRRDTTGAFPRAPIAKSPLASSSEPVVQRTVVLHFIAELPALLMKIFGGGEGMSDKEIRRQVALGDEHRKPTLANFVSNKIAEHAEVGEADAISYSPGQVAKIRELLGKLDRLGHEAEAPEHGVAIVKIDGGHFAKVMLEPRGLFGGFGHPDDPYPWSRAEATFNTLMFQLEMEIKSGEGEKIQGPSLPPQGPIDVDRDKVFRMFLGTETFVDTSIGVRGRPVSTMDEEE